MAKKVIQKQKGIDVSLSAEMLEYLLIAGMFTALVTAPYLLVGAIPAAQYASKQKRLDDRQLKNAYHYLIRRKYIRVKVIHDEVSITLTKRGKKQALEKALKTKLSSLKHINRAWDGKWRVLMYDIGANQRAKRELLRRSIKEAGFIQLQKSVWVYPHDCRREVAAMRALLGVDEGRCRLLVASEVGSAEVLKKKFNL